MTLCLNKSDARGSWPNVSMCVNIEPFVMSHHVGGPWNIVMTGGHRTIKEWRRILWRHCHPPSLYVAEQCVYSFHKFLQLSHQEGEATFKVHRTRQQQAEKHPEWFCSRRKNKNIKLDINIDLKLLKSSWSPHCWGKWKKFWVQNSSQCQSLNLLIFGRISRIELLISNDTSNWWVGFYGYLSLLRAKPPHRNTRNQSSASLCFSDIPYESLSYPEDPHLSVCQIWYFQHESHGQCETVGYVVKDVFTALGMQDGSSSHREPGFKFELQPLTVKKNVLTITEMALGACWLLSCSHIIFLFFIQPWPFITHFLFSSCLSSHT